MTTQTVTIQDAKLQLLPERAIWWAAAHTLFVADVHLGKDATFARHAIPLTTRTSEQNLQQLSYLLNTYHAQHLVILGDWLHAREGRSERVMQAISEWRESHTQIDMTLVEGNHDRGAGHLPDSWNFSVVPALELPPFICTHIPQDDPAENRYNLTGHRHPTVHLYGRGRQLIKLPCFWQRPRRLILPAFTPFSGQIAIRPNDTDRVYGITESSVIDVTAMFEANE
jgi:DNA ligase-associated metallophosphoesterase